MPEKDKGDKKAERNQLLQRVAARLKELEEDDARKRLEKENKDAEKLAEGEAELKLWTDRFLEKKAAAEKLRRETKDAKKNI